MTLFYRLAALESSTLLLLLFVGVPLKHLFGQPILVRYLGPVHGLAFLAYLNLVFRLWSGGSLSSRQARGAFLAALVPFGGVLFARRLQRCTS